MTLFGTMIRSAAASERHVEEPERADDPLDCPASAPPSRTRSPTRNGRVLAGPAGEHVAERLLGRETEHHRRERTADRERRVQPGDPQGDDDHRDDRRRRTRNPTVPAVPGSSRPKSIGATPRASERARAQPRTTRSDDGRDPHRRAEAGEQGLALAEEHQDAGDQGSEDETRAAGALRLGTVDLAAEADLAPLLGAALERGQVAQALAAIGVLAPPEWIEAASTPTNRSRASYTSRFQA